jgi:hypothetical protein
MQCSSLAYQAHTSSQNDSGVMIIFAGQNLGMGALIHSTINAIWLAQKLGKTPYIWWGNACLYKDISIEENTYSKLFQEPYPQFLHLNRYDTVYPTAWDVINSEETIQSLEKKAHDLESQNLELKVAERDALVASDICVVHQYLADDVAQVLAGITRAEQNFNKFEHECNLIFMQFFQPQKHIQSAAAALWEEIFVHKYPVLGIHCRGTDKIIETALPSPCHYLHALQQDSIRLRFAAFFIATDSLPALQQFQSKLDGRGIVGTQDITRSQNQAGLHFQTNGAFQNGVEMLIDIELLCRCAVVLAFPGSQIFWWLNRKRNAERHNFEILPVQPGSFEWICAIFFVLRTQGWAESVQYLRMQKGGLKALLFTLFKTRVKSSQKV